MALSSRMNVLLSLSLWLTLMMSSCCGPAGSHEEESTTEYYDDSTELEAVTADYDYNATFDYGLVTGTYSSEIWNKEEKAVRSEPSQAAGIGPLSLVLLLGLAVHQMWD